MKFSKEERKDKLLELQSLCRQCTGDAANAMQSTILVQTKIEAIQWHLDELEKDEEEFTDIHPV